MTLAVSKLDRREVKLNIGGSVHEPTDPVGRLRGKKPKLPPAQEKHLVSVQRAGTHTTTEIAELSSVARSTVYRAINRAEEPT